MTASSEEPGQTCQMLLSIAMDADVPERHNVFRNMLLDCEGTTEQTTIVLLLFVHVPFCRGGWGR